MVTQSVAPTENMTKYFKKSLCSEVFSEFLIINSFLDLRKCLQLISHPVLISVVLGLESGQRPFWSEEAAAQEPEVEPTSAAVHGEVREEDEGRLCRSLPGILFHCLHDLEFQQKKTI